MEDFSFDEATLIRVAEIFGPNNWLSGVSADSQIWMGKEIMKSGALDIQDLIPVATNHFPEANCPHLFGV